MSCVFRSRRNGARSRGRSARAKPGGAPVRLCRGVPGGPGRRGRRLRAVSPIPGHSGTGRPLGRRVGNPTAGREAAGDADGPPSGPSATPISIGWGLATSLGELAAARTGVRHYGPHGQANQTDLAVFVESHAPPPRMVIFGPSTSPRALPGGQGARLPRDGVRRPGRVRHPGPVPVRRRGGGRLAASGSSTRSGHRLGPLDAVCVLTHDAKFDVPAIVERPGHRRRLPRGHGQPHHHRRRLVRLAEEGIDRPGGPGPAPRPHRRSTSAAARPRRRRWSSAPRSSPLRTGHDGRQLRDTAGPSPLLRRGRRLIDRRRSGTGDGGHPVGALPSGVLGRPEGRALRAAGS